MGKEMDLDTALSFSRQADREESRLQAAREALAALKDKLQTAPWPQNWNKP